MISAGERRLLGAVRGRRRSASMTSSRDGLSWPRVNSPEWLALSQRPASINDPLEPLPVDVAMGYSRYVQESVAAEREARLRAHSFAEERSSEDDLPALPKTSFIENRGSSGTKKRTDGVERLLAFGMTPRQVKSELDRRVIGQTEAKKAIAVAISEHYHHARRCLEDTKLLDRHFHKQNVLLFGPSGVGKSALLRAAAEVANAPFVKADATKFSATGFVGRDVQEVLTQLIEAAHDDIDTASFGLVYVDEIDKICEKGGSLFAGGSTSSGVNTRDVQTALLKLMEDFEMPLAKKDTSDPAPRSSFSTKHVLFVFAGAFEFDRSARGNQSRLQSANDFIDLGLLPEFVGRIPIRVGLKDLSISDLKHILSKPSDVSPLSRYIDAFANHGITFTYDNNALDLIAQRAHLHRLGARGLLTEVESTLRHFSYHLPCCAALGLDHFHLDYDTVSNPKQALQRILDDFGLDEDEDDEASDELDNLEAEDSRAAASSSL